MMNNINNNVTLGACNMFDSVLDLCSSLEDSTSWTGWKNDLEHRILSAASLRKLNIGTRKNVEWLLTALRSLSNTSQEPEDYDIFLLKRKAMTSQRDIIGVTAKDNDVSRQLERA